MTKDLEYLIEEARKYEMSADEQRSQVRSFAYGNTHLENSAISRDDVAKAMNSLRAEREHAVHP